jgi:hypothetical protein
LRAGTHKHFKNSGPRKVGLPIIFRFREENLYVKVGPSLQHQPAVALLAEAKQGGRLSAAENTARVVTWRAAPSCGKCRARGHLAGGSQLRKMLDNYFEAAFSRAKVCDVFAAS